MCLALQNLNNRKKNKKNLSNNFKENFGICNDVFSLVVAFKSD